MLRPSLAPFLAVATELGLAAPAEPGGAEPSGAPSPPRASGPAKPGVEPPGAAPIAAVRSGEAAVELLVRPLPTAAMPRLPSEPSLESLPLGRVLARLADAAPWLRALLEPFVLDAPEAFEAVVRHWVGAFRGADRPPASAGRGAGERALPVGLAELVEAELRAASPREGAELAGGEERRAVRAALVRELVARTRAGRLGWSEGSVLLLELPVAGAAPLERARLVVARREARRRGAPSRREATLSVLVDIESRRLGAVAVHLVARGRRCRCSVLVERAATERAVRRRLGDLRAALVAAGYPAARARVLAWEPTAPWAARAPRRVRIRV